MNIKTLSEISSLLLRSQIPLISEEIVGLVREEDDRPSSVEQALTRSLNNSASDLTYLLWRQIEISLQAGFPLKASFVRDLGVHQKDPVRILTMLLLNLSPTAISELREALGIPELTPSP